MGIQYMVNIPALYRYLPICVCYQSVVALFCILRSYETTYYQPKPGFFFNTCGTYVPTRIFKMFINTIQNVYA